MDLSTVVPDLVKLSPLVALLVAIAYLLWKRNASLVKEGKAHYNELLKRVESDTDNCKESYKQAVDRIQHLEKRTYDDGRDDKAVLVQCVNSFGAAMEKMAELQSAREESSLQFAINTGTIVRRKVPKPKRPGRTPTEALERKEDRE